MRVYKLLSLCLLSVGVLCVDNRDPLTAGDKPKPAQGGELVVTDFNGKEHKLKTWKFTAGTRHLSWLAPAPPAEEKEKEKEKTPGKKGGKVGPKTGPAVGPEALEFSAGTGTPLVKRVLTYVPLENVRSLEFDHEKNTVTLHVAKTDKMEDDEVLVGVTGYVNINVLKLEAEADLGEFGVGQIKFQGGVKNGIKAIRFPAPKPLSAAKGRFAEVISAGKNKDSYKVADLQPLYQQAGGLLRAAPTLYFQTTVKLDIAKVAKLTQVGMGGSNWDVTLKSGASQPLEIIALPKDAGGKVLQLEGLVGRSAAGYQLFPLAAVSEIHFDEGKKAEKKSDI